jgi:hypothetical protein
MSVHAELGAALRPLETGASIAVLPTAFYADMLFSESNVVGCLESVVRSLPPALAERVRAQKAAGSPFWDYAKQMVYTLSVIYTLARNSRTESQFTDSIGMIAGDRFWREPSLSRPIGVALLRAALEGVKTGRAILSEYVTQEALQSRLLDVIEFIAPTMIVDAQGA